MFFFSTPLFLSWALRICPTKRHPTPPNKQKNKRKGRTDKTYITLNKRPKKRGRLKTPFGESSGILLRGSGACFEIIWIPPGTNFAPSGSKLGRLGAHFGHPLASFGLPCVAIFRDSPNSLVFNIVFAIPWRVLSLAEGCDLHQEPPLFEVPWYGCTTIPGSANFPCVALLVPCFARVLWVATLADSWSSIGQCCRGCASSV